MKEGRLKMIIDEKLFAILGCPICKRPLVLDADEKMLICRSDKFYYPVEEDIPNFLYIEKEKK